MERRSDRDTLHNPVGDSYPAHIHNHNPIPSPHHVPSSPQAHLHPQLSTHQHPIMNPQRANPAYYRPVSPDPAPAASSAGPSTSVPHYRRPSSPGPYGNPSGPYGSAQAPATTAHSAHYSQSYGRHLEYSKDDYHYHSHERRRDYESAEMAHDYSPMTRDLFRSSSPTRMHHAARSDAAVASTMRRPATSSSTPYHQGPPTSSSSHGSIYDHELRDRDRRVAHPSYSSGRYTARSPSPGPYGSPPGNISYRHYYEQQQQQHHQQQRQISRSYRQEYYASDGEGDGPVMSQHHHYQQPPSHSSRVSSYRTWPAGSHEAASRDYTPSTATQQTPYYSSSRQPLPSDRYESSGSVPPPRATSPYQPYAQRSIPHSTHPSTGVWSAQRTPELASRPPMHYRRRSASVDEGVDREKYETSPYNDRGPPSSYIEPTYIPSRSPSPVRVVQNRSERKAPAMSIAQLLSDKPSREPSPEFIDESPVDDRRSIYRPYIQENRPRDISPPVRFPEREPNQEMTAIQRYNESIRRPGQLAERARILPATNHTAVTGSHEVSTRRERPASKDTNTGAIDNYSSEVTSASTRPREERKIEALLIQGDIQSSSTNSTKTETWPEQGSEDIASTAKDITTKTLSQSVKRRPKAAEQDKRTLKPKAEENEAPVEEAKIKAKRGRKPKSKDNPLEGSALSLPVTPALTEAAPRPESISKSTNGGVKRQRAPDTANEDRDYVAPMIQGSQETGEQDIAGAHPDVSDSDQDDYSQHKEYMIYMLEVHKRGQKVQKAYEKQSSRKRRKLHEKFLAKQERRLEAKNTAEALAEPGTEDEEVFLGTQETAVGSPALSQPLQPTVGKGRGRGRKKLQPDNAVKREQDEDGLPKESKAERKRRERKEAAEAAAMAQVQAIKAKARAQQNELAAAALQEEVEEEEQDRHVPRSNISEDESNDDDFVNDGRIDFEASEEEEKGTAEQSVEPDEETLLRRQEKEYEAKRRAIWDLIAHRQIREVTKIVANATSIKMQNCKKVAQLCQREARKAAARSVKPSKEVHSRARKANREMLFFWKRNEREEREMRKKAEKEAIEKLRIEEEMREARRQARKLNFLITQTELYSHFIGKKIGTEAAEADDDAAPVRMQPSKEPHEDSIQQDPNHAPVEGDIDFEEATDEALEAQAKWGAQQALLAAQQRTKTFDEEAKEHREQKPNMALNQNDLDEMNFQNPSSMPTVAEIEQPKMLMCQLKGYQIKGLNWLANLYEQGINGILADEMGLGKTVQSISLMAYLAETQNIWGPFLVIAPASTLHNWQQEFTKFTPDLKALPYWGNIKDRKTLRKFWNKKQVYNKDAPFHVLITSYQLVVSDEKYFQRVKWQYMVLDEAQAIKSSSSARWKTLLGFNCRNRLLLTGTPIQNSMQELWALLHFIMPSLFDSHEEFSEWFSKDIESHAENKGTLNEHQLKRLHMILKPFMLRRIKKNVQNELGDKIELEVSCELTARQRALYRGLKEKISISELLEKASSLDDSDSVDSLMNLVMQFRKVCNHPELFERADVVSPLALCAFSQTPSIAREGDDLFVAYTTRSRINYSIPKRFYREGGLLRVPSEQSNAGTDTKYLDHLLNIWTPDHVAQSMFEEEGTFSFLRFTDYSPSQVTKISRSHLLDRFALHLELEDSRSRRGYGLDSVWDGDDVASANYPGNTFAKFVISESVDPFSQNNRSSLNHMKQLGHTLYKSELGEYLPMMEAAYRPKAVAPPIEMICSDRTFLVDQYEQMFDTRIRRLLLGVPEFRTEAVHQEYVAPIMDLWQVNQGRGLLGEPSLSSQGYSTIEVPQMKQLIMDSGKLAVLDKLLVELKAGGHRVLVYFQMTKMIDLMEEYLTYRQYKYLRLDGSSKISDRRDMVTDWQTRPEIFIFLLSTRAGGLGINLTAADTVIFYDSDWNPTVDQQAMDRAHRLGQTRQVTVYRLITRGTIEERILQRAKQKDEIQKVVISGGEFKQSVEFKPREIVSLLLDDDELATKLQEQQLKRKVEEEEAKSSRKGTSKADSGRPSKKPRKDGKDNKDTAASTPTASTSGLATKGRTLDEMWAEMDAQAAGEGAGAGGESNSGAGVSPVTKGKRGRTPKEKPPKEPKPKKEKEPKAKKPPKIGKKAQAAAAAAAAEGGGQQRENGDDVDVDMDADVMDM
ncbi:putative DNA helicase ino80 [Lobosporangium transversale]|nr:putative DNA helicase ino80 [Lobosporangium transversale]